MNPISRKSLIATAIAALIAAPAWAGGDAEKTQGSMPQTESSQPMNQPMETSPSTSPGTVGTPSQSAAPDTSSPLYTMTPRELRGTNVVGAGGKDIGSVKAVVRSRQQQNIQAVISSGGFLGIGDKEVTVPLDKLQYVDGKVHISATEDELKASPEYQPDQYVELEPKDQPISEFSAFEPTEQGTGSSQMAPSQEPGRSGMPAEGSSSESPATNKY